MIEGLYGAIPARFASTRLPGKPLIELAGEPMIRHVVRRAEEAGVFERVVVLTDDERIASAAESFGGDVEMTPAECASGTDRIAWATRRWPAAGAVVNIQGDEPLVDPAALARLGRCLAGRDGAPQADMVTLAAPLEGARIDDPNVVKVVCRSDGRALYFSRSPIPHRRHPDEGGAEALHHVGVYGYRRDVLLHLAALRPSPLERAEGLEQLRALEHGVDLVVLSLDQPAVPGVDTEDDVPRVDALLRAHGATHS
ncbi:MAG: 3-deoxy-manno-octulosonate cytidylyltransferase [Acidobacteriota bacterium]